jgi:hypothetical protein
MANIDPKYQTIYTTYSSACKTLPFKPAQSLPIITAFQATYKASLSSTIEETVQGEAILPTLQNPFKAT